MGNSDEKKADIQTRAFKFALGILELYKFMKKCNARILGNQILRSGTSIGANVEEAQAAQSKKDFIAKMSIASKEARETRYWLKLLSQSGNLDGFESGLSLSLEVEEIIRILTSIVKTSQERLAGEKQL
ncbi:MAG: four helix bundle protein [Acidobacteria bacterium]|nr:four helix bundle protein [Acidobacteriota bacterium]